MLLGLGLVSLGSWWLGEGRGEVPRKLVFRELSDGVCGNSEGGLEVCDEGGGVGKQERGA